MNTLEQRLNLLLKQKEALEEEIALLQKSLQIHSKEFSKDQKIELFKSLFVGRTDMYAKKWQSKDLTQERFFAVTQTFKAEDYLPLSNEALEEHLRGKEHLATYPILPSSMCKYLVLKIVQEDTAKIQMSLNKYALKGYFELTSCNDYHVWLFFLH